ncbi:MAG: endonuclease domain-containing protein [Patescibacteria group bacterium]
MQFVFNNPDQKDRRRELRKNQTDAERKFWQQIKNKKIAGLKFYRQFGVGPYILDFYCSKLRLAVELDGGQHSETPRAEYDTKRTEYLQSKNIKVLRFWNNDVLKNMEGVIIKLQEEIKIIL